MFIIGDTVAGSDWDTTVKHVEDLLKNRGVEILRSEKWEERKFAYKLKGHKRGSYLLVYFNAAPDSISLIKRDFELSDTVLRAMVVKIDKIRELNPETEAEKPAEEAGKIEADVNNDADAESKESNSAPVTLE